MPSSRVSEENSECPISGGEGKLNSRDKMSIESDGEGRKSCAEYPGPEIEIPIGSLDDKGGTQSTLHYTPLSQSAYKNGTDFRNSTALDTLSAFDHPPALFVWRWWWVVP